MFVSSEKFIEAHRGRLSDIAIYGQESPTSRTWRLWPREVAIVIVHGKLRWVA